ncbi:MAG: prepilin-type N-terminal cleavage/methylation domain-containing protein [Planctomycetota bacterium]|jgi:prepilin-type N-terminal cleavage/methylation domain-containing protein
MNLPPATGPITATAAPTAAERGFSLVEVTTAAALLAILLYGLHSTMLSAVTGRATVNRTDRVSSLASEYLDRLQAVPFGAGNGSATAAELEELFDDDQDLGTVTLRELRVPANQEGHWFVGTQDGVTGRWRIRVTNDLNGDGDSTDVAWREGRDDLLGVEIWFDDRLVVRAIRAAPVEETTADVGANY